MSGFIPAARAFYSSTVRPRVSRDHSAEKQRHVLQGDYKVIYKLKKFNEPGGEPVNLCGHPFDIHVFSNFGTGIALYFNTLITFSVISIISGAILIPSIITFNQRSDDGIAEDPRLGGTVACQSDRFNPSSCSYLGGDFTCNFQCGNSTCDLIYKPDCEYPGYEVSYPDLALCAFFAVSLVLAELHQNYLQKQIDNDVQTEQDYSLVVNNPPADAADPDEWQSFFERFGTVRYVSVIRDNKALLTLLLRKRLLLRQLAASVPFDVYDRRAAAMAQTDPSICTYLGWAIGVGQSSEQYQLRQLLALNSKIRNECQRKHPVCKIYVVFEKEDAKAHCIQVLSRENTALSTLVYGVMHRLRFRSIHCLNVKESSEQSNVLWQNAGISGTERFFRRVVAFIIVIAIMAACYMWIQFIAHSSLSLLITITVMDNCLPVVMSSITMIEGAEDEDDRQNSLMVKLFATRILTAVVFPFILIPWGKKFDRENIASISNLQLGSCFVSPFVKLVDPVGLVYRYVFTPLFAATQADANRYWFGTPFTLAERYTEVSKVMFISLFYSSLVPSALFIGGIAFLNLFLIDRYILLRTACPPPKLDNSMGPTLSKQLAFALVCKMLVTILFVYSWPMDDIFRESNGDYKKVNKDPNILPLWQFRQQQWQSHEQWRSVVYYIDAFYVGIAFCILIFMFEAFEKIFVILTEASIQCANQTPFISVESIVAYCPIVRFGPESFVAADTRHMLTRHRPDTIDLCDATAGDGEFNLADYLSLKAVAENLSIVKWYGCEEESGAESKEELLTSPAAIESINIELGGEMVPARRSREKRVVPYVDANDDIIAVPILSFTAEERMVLKKLRAELRKNNLRTKFRNNQNGVQDASTLVDYNQFIDSIRSYCPALFEETPSIFLPTANVKDNGGGADSRGRHNKMKLRLIFVKLINQQNGAGGRQDKTKVDIAQFFRALVENEFQLRGE